MVCTSSGSFSHPFTPFFFSSSFDVSLVVVNPPLSNSTKTDPVEGYLKEGVPQKGGSVLEMGW
jgi:hypothetical protein